MYVCVYVCKGCPANPAFQPGAIGPFRWRFVVLIGDDKQQWPSAVSGQRKVVTLRGFAASPDEQKVPLLEHRERCKAQ